jgi:hypothetical protein
MRQSIQLLDEIIQMEQARDAAYKKAMRDANKLLKSDGESQMLFHLKALKELLDKEQVIQPLRGFRANSLILDDATFQVVESPYRRRGCIGTAWCPNCQVMKNGTCFCMLICPDCRGQMRELTEEEGNRYKDSGWSKDFKP